MGRAALAIAGMALVGFGVAVGLGWWDYQGRSRPGDAFRVEGDQLVLAPCGGVCSTDYDVTVPRGTTVTGSTTSGLIRLQETGPVNVFATSGDIEVTLAEPQDVRAHTTGEMPVPGTRCRPRPLPCTEG